MWPRRDVIDLLGIEHPILQAPMAGAATPALAAAVSNAGGLGALGCGFLGVDRVRAVAGELRAAPNRPINLNFFVFEPPVPDADLDARIRGRVEPFFTELGLGEPPTASAAPYVPFHGAMLELMLEVRPAVVSFHFGIPQEDDITALHDAGTKLLGSATTVEEARMLEAAGFDAVIAQGFEAGGHRGAFDTVAEDVGIGTMALVPQIVDAVRVPVIASGGIGDARGLAAAFALGASGVQMGTAFLSCPEAGVTELHRRALADADGSDTRLSRGYTGQACRMRRNRYTDAMAGTEVAAYPSMLAFADPLRGTGHPEFVSLLYGQAAGLSRPMPAADLVETLVAETRPLLPAGG